MNYHAQAVDMAVADMREMNELIERRTEFTKTFDCGDGETIVAQGAGGFPLHYKEDGEWQDINIGWEPTEDGWRTTGAPYGLRVPKSGIRCHVERDGLTTDLELITPLWAEARPIAHRLFWSVSDSLEIYIAPHTLGLSFHYIMRCEASPKRFQWRETGHPMRWDAQGRDNLTRDDPSRLNADATRRLEITTDFTDGVHTIEWTGRVIQLDKLRRRSWGEPLYPARMVH